MVLDAPVFLLYSSKGKVREHADIGNRGSPHYRVARAPVACFCSHDHRDPDCFCCGLYRVGLYLSSHPHWDRIVSSADSCGAPPFYRGTFPLSRPPVENRHPTDRSQLAHRHGHWLSIALRWQRGVSWAEQTVPSGVTALLVATV